MNCSEGKEGSRGGGKATAVLTACDKDLAIKRPVMSNRGQQKMRTDNQGFEVVAATFAASKLDGLHGLSIINSAVRWRWRDGGKEGSACILTGLWVGAACTCSPSAVDRACCLCLADAVTVLQQRQIAFIGRWCLTFDWLDVDGCDDQR